MTTPRHRLQQFVLHALIPVVCSTLLGMLFFGWNVVDRTTSAFQFLWTPVVMSVFYYLLRYARVRDAYLGLIGLFALTFLTTESTSALYIVRDILYFGAVALSIHLYVSYFSKHASTSPLYPAVTLGALYPLLYLVAAEVQLGIVHLTEPGTHGVTPVSLAESTAFFGLLIGFAVGCGISVAERMFGPSGT